MLKVSAQVRPKRRAPITRVLLVGGATRMPAFRRFVRNMTGLEAKGAAVDPDEVRSMISHMWRGEVVREFCSRAVESSCKLTLEL